MRRCVVGAVGLVVASGCGRVGFDGVAFSAGADAVAITPTCSAWGPPRPQTALTSTSEDWEPTLSPDGLEMVFSTRRSGRSQLYYASRTSLSADFDAPSLIASLDVTLDTVYGPNWQYDGKLLYFTSDGSSAHARLANILGGGEFSVDREITDVPPGFDQYIVSSNGMEMFSTRYRDLGNMVTDVDLYYATKTSGSWSDDNTFLPPGVNREEANLYDGWPALDEVHHEMIWERAGTDGAGDLRVIRRTAEGQPFEAATDVSLGFAGFTGDPSLDATATIMAFTGKAQMDDDTDLFLATRTCE